MITMKKKVLKSLNQDSRQNENILMEIPTEEIYKQYEEEYMKHMKQYDEERFIHAKNINDINTIFEDIILTRLDYVIDGKITNQFKCCLDGCSKISLYEMKYRDTIKHICWYHLCNIINKY